MAMSSGAAENGPSLKETTSQAGQKSPDTPAAAQLRQQPCSPEDLCCAPHHQAYRRIPGLSRDFSALPELTKVEINALPIQAYEGEIHLIESKSALEEALTALRQEAVLGFDTESKPSFTRGKVSNPSLIQLAATNVVYLVQLNLVPFNESLAALLADPAIIKTGVGIKDDMKALGKLHPFQAGGVVDLASLAKSRGIKAQGLRTLTAALLGFRISKGAQCSNWAKPTLSQRQIRYAATDAWVGRELYLVLNEGYNQ